jgi:3D-(3,5/4)-trihydroxycyclohexane-1,2-dione acylhydrolase (decyclizing)
VGLEEISSNLGNYRAPASWTTAAQNAFRRWMKDADAVTAATNAVPSDAQVIGAVQRALGRDISMLCASGGLPGELHKLWQASYPSSYHLEYGFSCMGYEIAGGLGMKMAQPDREVVVMVGDGSYLMMNSEIATSVMLGAKLLIVVVDNRGFGCINRLQKATGGARFNNLFVDSRHEVLPEIDFAAHARSLGAIAQKVSSISDLERALREARANDRTTVLVIDTDPMVSTEAGGHWWDVAVPEVSERSEVQAARKQYEAALAMQRLGD